MLPPLVTHTISVAQLQVASGQIGDIEIDKITPGQAQVGRLTLGGTSLTINSGSAFLHNVRFLLQLQFTLGYWYNLGFGISGSGSDDLGTIAIPFNVGNVLVPT